MQELKHNASKQYALSPYPSCSLELSFVCFSFPVSTQIAASLSRCRICALWLLCYLDCLSTTGPGNPAQNFQAFSSAAVCWIQPIVSRSTMSDAKREMDVAMTLQALGLLVLVQGTWGTTTSSRKHNTGASHEYSYGIPVSPAKTDLGVRC